MAYFDLSKFAPRLDPYVPLEEDEQQPPAPVNTQGIIGDTVDAFQAGAWSAAGGIADFVGAERMAQSLYGRAQANYDEMSQSGREAMGKKIIEQDEQGGWGLGDGATDFDTWLLGFANMTGQFAATAIPGAGAAGAVSRAAGWAGKGKAAANITGLAATGGSAATGQAMDQARQEYLQIPLDVKAQSDIFKTALQQVETSNPQLTEQEKIQAADTLVAQQIADEVRADPKVLLANFGASAIGDPVIGRALTGIRIAKGGIARSGAKGFAIEGSTEAAQAGVSEFGVNQAVAQVDNRDPWQGVAEAAANEGILGGAFGGAIGAAGGFANRQPNKSAPTDPATEAVRQSNPALAAELDVLNTAQQSRTEQVQQVMANADLQAAQAAPMPEASAVPQQSFVEQRRAELEQALQQMDTTKPDAAKQVADINKQLSMLESDRSFASVMSLTASKPYRDAVKAGLPIEIVPAKYRHKGNNGKWLEKDGFKWQQKPADLTPVTALDAAAPQQSGSVIEPGNAPVVNADPSMVLPAEVEQLLSQTPTTPEVTANVAEENAAVGAPSAQRESNLPDRSGEVNRIPARDPGLQPQLPQPASEPVANSAENTPVADAGALPADSLINELAPNISEQAANISQATDTNVGTTLSDQALDLPEQESNTGTFDIETTGTNVRVYGDPAQIRQQLRAQGINFEGAPIEGGLTFGLKQEQRIRAALEPVNNAEPAADLAGAPIDQEWTAFADDTGTKKIPRAEMPQIKAEHRGAMVQFMKGRDITHEQDTIPAADLKPTQAEFSPAKVKKAMEFDGGNRSILVSSDGYVLDGHHQWLAAREKGDSVDVIRLNAPIDRLVPLAKEFPSSTLAGGAVETKSVSNTSQAEQSAPKTLRDRKEAARKSKSKESPAAIRASSIIGAKVGDRIRIDGAIGYAGNADYQVDQIASDGTVFIKSDKGTTNLNLSELIASQRRGEVKFTKLDAPKAASNALEAKPTLKDRKEAARASRNTVAMPEVLTLSKNAYLKKQAKKQQLRESSPGYEQALSKLDEQYDTDYDRALAGLTFEQFNEVNKGVPESLNRQAYAQLREDFGLPKDVKFSKTVNKSDADNYRAELERTMRSLRSRPQPIRVGKTPDVMIRFGAPDLDLYISKDTIQKATNKIKEDHDVPMSVIEQLPELLADPIAVLDDSGEFKGQVVIVNAVTESGKPVAVAVHLDVEAGRAKINRIASAYGRNSYKRMKLLYLNENKNPALVRLIRSQLPSSGSPLRGSDSNVLSKEDLVNENPDIKFAAANTTGTKPAKGVPVSVAQREADRFVERLSGAAGIKVVVLPTQKDAEKLWRMSLDGDFVRGAYSEQTGTVYIIAENARNMTDLKQTIAHELFAHGGLDKVIGADKKQEFLNRLKSTRGKKEFKGLWSQIDRDYDGMSEDVKAEELFAYFVQNQPQQGPVKFWWNAFKRWLNNALAAVGITKKGDPDIDLMQSMMESIMFGFQFGRQADSNAEGDIVFSKGSTFRTEWGRFPDVVIHNTLGSATQHPDYEAAKGGDIAAALSLVKDLISVEKLQELKRLAGEESAITLAVHAEESISRNKIPQAMAEYIGAALGLDVDVDIVQASYAGRTGLDGFGRLAIQPSFDGEVQSGKAYILMDDTLTQGGTLANLKGYVEANGGRVLAATALTGKQYSAKLAMSDETLSKLRESYGETDLEQWWENEFGYGFDKLTESEGRYLLNAKDADKIRDRVSAARQSAGAQSSQENSGSDENTSDLKFSRTRGEPDARTAKEKLGLDEQAQETLKEKAIQSYKDTADTLKSSKFWQRLNEGIFDGLAGIKAAEVSVGVTDPNKQGYVSARLASGLADVLHGVFHYGAPQWKDGIVARKPDTKGLLEVFSSLGDDLNNWLSWMGANRAEKLMAEGRENNLTAADIAELKALASGKEQLFEDVRKEYNKINSAIIDLAQEAGLISAEQRAGFDEEWYVPFFRDMDVDPEMQGIAAMVHGPKSRNGIANQNAQLKELKGGKQSTRDLLENIIHRHSTLIDASLKNNAMLEIVRNLGDSDYMQPVTSPEIAALSQTDLNKLQKVKVMRDGKPEAYAVSDAALLRGLLQINDAGSRSLINKLGRSAKRFLTAGITLSPDFIVKNFVRDAAHAWMVNKDEFKFGSDSIKGLQKAFKEDEAYRDLIFSGAAFQGGYVHGADPEAAAQQVRRALEQKGLNKKQIESYMGSLVTKGSQLLERYRNASDKVENANRLMTYEGALKAGKSARQAAFEAKDLMDYSLKGNFALIGSMIDFLPFFNARLQGMSKLVRAARASDNDRVLKVLSANLAMKGMKVAAFSLALAALHTDDERYKELADWDKDSNWHFWLGDDHIRIPKPFELGIIFGTFPERMLHFSTGNQPSSDLAKAVGHALFNTLALNPIPQFALPIFETAVNKSFFRGTDIENMSDENKLKEDRYNAYTSDTAKLIGKISGHFNVSPKQVEHLVIGYTGTIGGYVLSISDVIARTMLGIEAADAPISRYPVIKAFYQGSGPKTNTKFQQEFYDAIKAANQAYGSYKRAAEEGNTERQQMLLEKNKDKLSSRIQLNRLQRQISELNKQADRVNINQSLTGEQKREKLDEIARRKNALYQAAYVRFNLGEW